MPHPRTLRSLACRKPLLLALLFLTSILPAQRPNIIYIMTDDMGYGDLGSYGQDAYATPNLDRLALAGITLTHAYAAAPVCTPTRTAFMTGRYPARTPVGLIEPLTSTPRDSAVGLTKAYPSIGTLLQTAGYETALIGKWHLGTSPQHKPTANGFDYFYGILSGAADYLSYKNQSPTRDHDLYENTRPVHPNGYLTDLLTGKAVEFITQDHPKPFFLALTYNAPHWPWQGPNDAPYPDTVNFRAGGSPAIYAEMMKHLDDGIGQLLDALEDRGLTEETVIIFTNDNGGERYSDNGGLSNGKMTLWEGGIRVPAFVRWPGHIHEGSTTSQVAVTMDWTATILALAGARPDKDFPVDGIDLMPHLTGKKRLIPRTLYWRTTQRTQQKAMRSGNWKYLRDEKGEYLFDLSTDQREKHDLKATQARVFDRLKREYDAWEKTVLAPIPL